MPSQWRASARGTFHALGRLPDLLPAPNRRPPLVDSAETAGASRSVLTHGLATRGPAAWAAAKEWGK